MRIFNGQPEIGIDRDDLIGALEYWFNEKVKTRFSEKVVVDDLRISAGAKYCVRFRLLTAETKPK